MRHFQDSSFDTNYKLSKHIDLDPPSRVCQIKSWRASKNMVFWYKAPTKSRWTIVGMGSDKIWQWSDDDIIKWPFVRGAHQSPVNSLTKASDAGLWCFRFRCVWTNGWVNNRDAGDLGLHWAPYDVTVMVIMIDMFCVTVKIIWLLAHRIVLRNGKHIHIFNHDELRRVVAYPLCHHSYQNKYRKCLHYPDILWNDILPVPWTFMELRDIWYRDAKVPLIPWNIPWESMEPQRHLKRRSPSSMEFMELDDIWYGVSRGPWILFFGSVFALQTEMEQYSINYPTRPQPDDIVWHLIPCSQPRPNVRDWVLFTSGLFVALNWPILTTIIHQLKRRWPVTRRCYNKLYTKEKCMWRKINTIENYV